MFYPNPFSEHLFWHELKLSPYTMYNCQMLGELKLKVVVL